MCCGRDDCKAGLKYFRTECVTGCHDPNHFAIVDQTRQVFAGTMLHGVGRTDHGMGSLTDVHVTVEVAVHVWRGLFGCDCGAFVLVFEDEGEGVSVAVELW